MQVTVSPPKKKVTYNFRFGYNLTVYEGVCVVKVKKNTKQIPFTLVCQKRIRISIKSFSFSYGTAKKKSTTTTTTIPTTTIIPWLGKNIKSDRWVTCRTPLLMNCEGKTSSLVLTLKELMIATKGGNARGESKRRGEGGEGSHTNSIAQNLDLPHPSPPSNPHQPLINPPIRPHQPIRVKNEKNIYDYVRRGNQSYIR